MEIKLDVNAISINEDLKLNTQSQQLNPLVVSELVFGTRNVDVDKDLQNMFHQLNAERQKMFENNGGEGAVKNIFINILDRTKDLPDHKVLPDEAISLMFQVGTSVKLDHTLVKDSKMSQEQMQLKAQSKNLDASLGDIMASLNATVQKNNAAPAPAATAADIAPAKPASAPAPASTPDPVPAVESKPAPAPDIRPSVMSDPFADFKL